MRKIIVLVLVTALLLVLGTTCALASPEDWQGRTLPDFSVNTIGGSTFTLSESLKTHDLVLINLWATWCGPCRMEFPYLETAWQQYGSRVDVIALSIEETDMMGAFISGGKYLAHVHLAGGLSDPKRSIPGQNQSRFVEGFRGLKYIGYDRFCSFECGVRGDREVEIPKAVAFLKREWELAVV